MRDRDSISKINLLKGKNDLKSKYYTSIEIPFEDIRKWYKKYSYTTFNDYFMGVLSVSMKKWLKFNGEDTKSLLARSPVATKGLPTNSNELHLTNKCVSIKYEYPLTDTIEEGIQNWRNSIKPNLNPFSIMAKLKTSSLLSLFPLAFLKRFIPKVYDVDFWVSNFPLSNKNFKFNGKKIIDIRPFVNWLNYCNLYIFAFTYVDTFKIHIMANDKMTMDPQQLLEIITYELQNEISNFKDL